MSRAQPGCVVVGKSTVKLMNIGESCEEQRAANGHVMIFARPAVIQQVRGHEITMGCVKRWDVSPSAGFNRRTLRRLDALVRRFFGLVTSHAYKILHQQTQLRA